jgi:hypothetical protein
VDFDFGIVKQLNAYFKKDFCRNLKECRLGATFTGQEQPAIRSEQWDLQAGPSAISQYCLSLLKGQCHEIFCFWFFFLESSSPFFEISRRYLQVKVHQRYHDTRGKFATNIARVVNTGGKFATGVNDS